MSAPPVIRPIEAHEHRAFIEAFLTTLGKTFDEDLTEQSARGVELDRTLAIEDDGRIVATARGISFRLTLPGGAQVPVAGLTAVGVLPTHRRRGLARALVARHLDDARSRGEVASVLLASEGAIYARFGYGPATWLARREVDRSLARLRPGPPDEGRMRLLEVEEAKRLLPQVYERARSERAGFLDRNAPRWERTLADPPSRRSGGGALQIALHEDAEGRPDGYAVYRLTPHWHEDSRPEHTAALDEAVALTPAVARALWAYLLGLDLVRLVRASALALDDPLPWLLEDRRAALARGETDLLWLRPLDVPTLLSARRYATSGRLAIEVVDGFRPAEGGRFALAAGPDGTECRPTEEAPEIVLDASDLGAALLGGVSPSQLAVAGRVEERAPGAIDRADAMLRSRPPWCTTYF